ncbi:tRNA dihydrouridine(20/20a) synthase DusA [Halieaceae bacterium IMCC14734]|uniref:tRNA-dihydrouridine(20/20a) synthase n=1 Tax=Candidatus Litorirhabdus singularis TaxID=2518993 RepID=A0ABT3TID3_9GAMM|nr:tRNA dihydrouridine(20/20a) synthase DusA [Candidatus Litorirhabdus singularis]MCX2982072.1 tRNA dihydrouridine(20/20a) synthase DusA [Candidatus Litorirhabdus singularis]
MEQPNRRFSVAPMMDWSDRHCRYFWRLLSKQALLYTEMVTTGALIHGDRERFLRYNPEEHPLALQLGGSNTADLAQCAVWAEEWGYDEVNLNCGCPSDRVQSGMFGACLMAQPQLVADCVKAMQDACSIPVTVKHRIGIDDMESWQEMADFVDTIATTGCNTFIVHARKAWLQGLSPKQNREVPPLEYEWVYRLKRERPDLEIIINGGINSLAAAQQHLEQVDGVMLGREAYQNPYLLAEVDQQLLGHTSAVASREQILLQLMPYVAQQLAQGTALNHISRHLLGLFQGVPGARKFRRHISENAWREGAGIEVLETALGLVLQETERLAS